MTVQWLECFAKWDTGNQMVFSIVMVIAVLVLLVLSGIWFLTLASRLCDYVAIWLRGYPTEDVLHATVSQVSASDQEFRTRLDTLLTDVEAVLKIKTPQPPDSDDDHDLDPEVFQEEPRARLSTPIAVLHLPATPQAEQLLDKRNTCTALDS